MSAAMIFWGAVLLLEHFLSCCACFCSPDLSLQTGSCLNCNLYESES